MTKYVRDIMNVKLVTVSASDSVGLVLKLMREKKLRNVLIPPPRGGRMWRIFTETDLLLALDSGDDPKNIPVGSYASPITRTARPDWIYEKAREEMINSGVKHLPVIDNEGNVVGIISSMDIINQY